MSTQYPSQPSSIFAFPPPPSLPPERATVAPGHLRYEDVAQDGRLMPIALPPQLGNIWRALLSRDAAARAATQSGIIPILTRLTLVTTPQHIRLDRPVEARGGYELAHVLAVDSPTTVDRLVMNMWCDLYGARGRLVPPEPAGDLALAGHMFAEHTFTRPFGPPDQRKVTSLPPPFPTVPEARYDQRDPRLAGEPPPDATDVDPEPTPDGMDLVFTLDQTDSNQHVNSLVYIDTFLGASQRRFAARGFPLRIRSREIDIAYRKPCFAGDRVRVHLRAFRLNDHVGTAGYVAGTDGKPRCYIRTLFGP